MAATTCRLNTPAFGFSVLNGFAHLFSGVFFVSHLSISLQMPMLDTSREIVN